MFARICVQNQTVAIGIPLIPIVADRRFANLVLRLIAGTLNRNELAFPNARATLLCGNFYFTFTHQHFRMIVARNQNSKAGIAPFGTNRHVRSIDFGIRIAVTEDGVVRHSVSELNLDLRTRELCNVRLRMF
jgi:hypothetical protein